MKTIKQVAEELGETKQRVYRYVKKYHHDKAHQIQGVWYIDDTLEPIVYQHFKEANEYHPYQVDMSRGSSHDEALIQQLKDQIKQLQEDNSFLKEQINSKDSQIERTQQLLNNEQALHLQANNKLAELKDNYNIIETKYNNVENQYKKTIFGLYKKIKRED